MGGASNRNPRADEFARLLQQYRGRLFAYVHLLVRNMADADDVFQQTALTLFRKFDAYDASRDFLPWACGIARLEAAEFLRVRARDRLRFSDPLTLALLDAFTEMPEPEAADRQLALPGCVDKLAEADRRLLADCYEAGADVPSIAERMGRPARSVYNSLRRIRRALFECVERAMARRHRGEA
jgi:RNA polymerase sigma-70 factor (ECF subfamily)